MSRKPLLSWLAAGCVLGVLAITLSLLTIGQSSGAVQETLAPEADTYARADRPTQNYGTHDSIDTDGDPQKIAYLRFTIPSGPAVTRARLRLWVENPSPVGGTVKTTSANWGERTLNWNNRPPLGATLGDLGPAREGEWVELDVTSAVRAGATLSLGIVSSYWDGADYGSRESAHPPQLVITRDASTTPTPTAPTTSTPAPSPTASATSTPQPSPTPQPTDSSQLSFDRLAQLLSSPTSATARVYGLKDDRGNSMDTLKVIASPAGGYLGIYHTLVSGTFVVKLATSADLLHWSWKVDLDRRASQPTLAQLPDGSFLVVHEAEPDSSGSHLRFLHYSNLQALLASTPDRTFDAPRTLSKCNEGTPSVERVALNGDLGHSTITIGFHYNSDCNTGLDRQATGTLTNFSSWSAQVARARDDALSAAGAPGKHGDRDWLPTGSAGFGLFEAQISSNLNDWTSWRVFLWDASNGTARRLDVKTDRGSVAFANPTFTLLPAPNGQQALVATYFLPSEGAASGEAGTLLFYTVLNTTPQPAPSPTPTPTPAPSPTPGTTPTPTPTPTPPPTSGKPVVVVAAGDIACDPSSSSWNNNNGTSSACRHKYTAQLAAAQGPDYVFALGDTQYEDGALAKYQQSYDPTWGQLKGLTYPAVGNHEYGTSGAAGYFGYFGARASPREPGCQSNCAGYYAVDLGNNWRAYALNSNCAQVGGCGPGSPQYEWLKADLAANAGKQVVAFWHHPRYSSGQHGDFSQMDPIWDLLYQAGAEVVLAGHDHDYERFAPMNASDGRDDARGVREFVVGTGGKSLYSFSSSKPNSEVRRNDAYGVLVLKLYPDHYEWAFVSEAGTVLDSGTAPVH